MESRKITDKKYILDVVGAAYGSNSVSWFENDGSIDNNFEWIETPFASSIRQAICVHAVDYDGDGDQHIVAVGLDYSWLVVMVNNRGWFEEFHFYGPLGGAFRLTNAVLLNATDTDLSVDLAFRPTAVRSQEIVDSSLTVPAGQERCLEKRVPRSPSSPMLASPAPTSVKLVNVAPIKCGNVYVVPIRL